MVSRVASPNVLPRKTHPPVCFDKGGTGMSKRIFVFSLLMIAALVAGPLAKPKAVVQGTNNISVYGAWHCGNEFCSWASVRNITDFDTRNRWLINRGDGTPSVNLVVLSFVQP